MPEHIASDPLDKLPSMCALNFVAAKTSASVSITTNFTDLLTRLVNGWPQKHIDELMPWHWAPQRPP
jgi:hypothetical protein